MTGPAKVEIHPLEIVKGIKPPDEAALWPLPVSEKRSHNRQNHPRCSKVSQRIQGRPFLFLPAIYNIMLGGLCFLVATAVLTAVPSLASVGRASTGPQVPSLDVPACPATAALTYSKSVPDRANFNLTQVELCYSATAIRITFTAFNETNFHFNPNHTLNDPIYEYEVMEAFISAGHDDPSTYFEFEVSPNNVTFNAFILNPSKVRAAGSPFGGAYVSVPSPLDFGITATTTLDRAAQTWVSTARIPLFIFNVNEGMAKGTRWRMNFFRTITAPDTFPAQRLGAWNPPSQANFHMTPFFGRVRFV